MHTLLWHDPLSVYISQIYPAHFTASKPKSSIIFTHYCSASLVYATSACFSPWWWKVTRFSTQAIYIPLISFCHHEKKKSFNLLYQTGISPPSHPHVALSTVICSLCLLGKNAFHLPYIHVVLSASHTLHTSPEMSLWPALNHNLSWCPTQKLHRRTEMSDSESPFCLNTAPPASVDFVLSSVCIICDVFGFLTRAVPEIINIVLGVSIRKFNSWDA